MGLDEVISPRISSDWQYDEFALRDVGDVTKVPIVALNINIFIFISTILLFTALPPKEY